MILRLLQPGDERAQFACGDADCDDFLHRYAAQNQFERHLSTTLVVAEDEREVAYATFALGEVSRDVLPAEVVRRLPGYPLPVLRLGRLAVDLRYQKIGLGTRLVREVLATALRLRSEIGCVAVLVDALPGAVGFYRSLGFEPAQPVTGRSRIPRTTLMTLPLTVVAAAAQEHAGAEE